MSIPDFVHDDLTKLGFELPPPLLEQLACYLDLLLDANQRVNLTAVRDPDTAWRRLILDSLTPLPALDDLPEDAALIDIGSGGGMPGIPLAIARPDLRVALLEATGKKAQALQAFTDALHLANVAVLHDRAETLGHNSAHRARYDAAVCRAIGPLNELLEYGLPLVKVGGLVLAMKGPKAQAELEDAGDALTLLGGGQVQVFDAYPEGFDLHTVIVAVTKAAPTPKAYPRSPGTPRHAPLGSL
jgi:16S rRNA (guanine527-N7)-methyltransferase